VRYLSSFPVSIAASRVAALNSIPVLSRCLAFCGLADLARCRWPVCFFVPLMNVNTWTSSLYNPNYCFTYRPCAMLVNWPCVMLIKWPYVMLIKWRCVMLLNWPCVMLLNWPCAMLIKWPCVMTCVMLIDWPCLMITDLACWFAWWPADANWLTLRDDLRDDNWPCVLTCVMTLRDAH